MLSAQNLTLTKVFAASLLVKHNLRMELKWKNSAMNNDCTAKFPYLLNGSFMGSLTFNSFVNFGTFKNHQNRQKFGKK